MSVRGQYLTTAEVRVLTESDGVPRRHHENLEASKRGVFLGLLLIILSCVAILVGMLIGNLMTHGKAKLADEIELGFEARWSAVDLDKSDDRIKQIDAEHKFEVIDSPPQVTDDFDQGSQSQTDITGSAAPIRTASAAASIDIDQSLAIEFPIAVYEPHKSADAMTRHPLRRAKVAAKRSVSNNPQANSGANSKPIELPPNFTNSTYWRYCRAQFGNRDPGPCAVDYRAELRNRR